MSSESPIVNAWNSASEWLNGREHRERLIILVCTVGILALIWFQVSLDPALTKQNRYSAEIEPLKTDIRSLEQTKAEVKQKLQMDPNARLREDIARLESLGKTLDVQVEQLSASWITPAAMVDALRQLLVQRGKLKLVSLTSEQPETLAAASRQSGRAQATAAAAGDGDFAQTVYVHGLELVLEGSFFDVLDYLDAVEGIPWEFHWQLLNYEVEEFPSASVTLRVQTYSSEKGWIGV